MAACDALRSGHLAESASHVDPASSPLRRSARFDGFFSSERVALSSGFVAVAGPSDATDSHRAGPGLDAPSTPAARRSLRDDGAGRAALAQGIAPESGLADAGSDCLERSDSRNF